VARVVFPDHLLRHTGGEREFQIPAATYRDLLLALESRFAGIGEVLERCAVAIDGQIYQDAFLEPLNADSEVFIMQRIEGG
jgi:sulfur carrier protein ThiS